MIKYFFLVLIAIPIFSFTQTTTYRSPKFGYSFTIPKGWKKSDNISFKNVDTKIVDGKGNSFIVCVEEFDEPIGKTAKEIYEEISTSQLEEMSKGVFGEGSCNIIRRGTVYLNGKEFYYIHSIDDGKNGKLLQKMYVYCYGNKNITLNASCFNSSSLEISPFLAVMITSFKL